MKLIFILGLYLCTAGLNISAQNNWEMLSTSTVTFKIKNAGFTVNGSLSGLKTEIRFSAAEPSQSAVQASVEVKTINTGISARDSHLKKPEYFDVEKYPLITMKSRKIAASTSGNYVGYFSLNIKNVEKEVTVPFKFILGKESSRLEGNFTINRRDFGVGGSSFILADKVEIFLNIVMKEKK